MLDKSQGPKFQIIGISEEENANKKWRNIGRKMDIN